MMLGFCGAHRTGKTTLARAFAERNDMRFVETSVSAIFRDLGYDPSELYDFSTRLTIQEEILKRMEELYRVSSIHRACCDRTPLDFLAYTLGDAIGDRVPVGDQRRFKRYVENCFLATRRWFTALVVVQPGIPLVHESGKAAMNEAYIEHLNSIVLGLAVDERLGGVPHFFLPRHCIDLDARVDGVEYAFNQTQTEVIKERGKIPEMALH